MLKKTRIESNKYQPPYKSIKTVKKSILLKSIAQPLHQLPNKLYSTNRASNSTDLQTLNGKRKESRYKIKSQSYLRRSLNKPEVSGYQTDFSGVGLPMKSQSEWGNKETQSFEQMRRGNFSTVNLASVQTANLPKHLPVNSLNGIRIKNSLRSSHQRFDPALPKTASGYFLLKKGLYNTNIQ